MKLHPHIDKAIAKQKDTIEEAYHRSRHQNELPDQPFGLDIKEAI
jgi:hypothetical protein